MNTRHLPPIAALALLVASFALWPPARSTPPAPPPLPKPLLPSAAELPEFAEAPESVTVFDASRRRAAPATISINSRPPAQDGPANRYRLCAYIGGNGLWVATLKDDAGKYCTLRNGENIPRTHMEFRGIVFRASSNGLQEGTAVFYDSSTSNYVDVVAATGDEDKPHHTGRTSAP